MCRQPLAVRFAVLLENKTVRGRPTKLHLADTVPPSAVQEVNDLARKNKDSIEGLAAEIRKFKV